MRPYGYANQLEREAVKVLDKAGLAAFERAVRNLLEVKDSSEQPSNPGLPECGSIEPTGGHPLENRSFPVS